MRVRSVRRELLRAMLMTSLASLLLACLALLVYELFAYQRTMTHNLAILSQTLAAKSSALLVYDDKKLGQELLAGLKAEPDVDAACFYDQAGRLFAHYPEGAPRKSFPPVPVPAGLRFSWVHLTSSTPVLQSGSRVGTVFIREDLRGMYTRFGVYVGVVVLVMAAALGVAFLLSSYFQARLAQPILALTTTARRISEQKDFSVRAVLPPAAEELSVLQRAFNEMLEQIHQRDLSLQSAAQVLEARVTERTLSLEETTRQLYDFCYTIAHDLKAPIRAQAAYARLLLEDFGAQLGEEGTAFAGRILEAAERQSRLVSDLLAHVSLGRSELPLAAVDLAATLAQVRSDLSLEIERQQAALDLAGVKGLVLANAASTHLVVLNLFSNALKFTPRGTAPSVKAWTEPRDAGLRLWVQDNGIGIPSQHLDKLFAMFQRLHTREEYPGSGIGLAIVKRAVERMNGRVGVESEPGKGSRFWVELPRYTPPGEA